MAKKLRGYTELKLDYSNQEAITESISSSCGVILWYIDDRLMLADFSLNMDSNVAVDLLHGRPQKAGFTSLKFKATMVDDNGWKKPDLKRAIGIVDKLDRDGETELVYYGKPNENFKR